MPSPLEGERLRIVIVERTRKQSVLETKQVMTLVMFSSKKIKKNENMLIMLAMLLL